MTDSVKPVSTPSLDRRSLLGAGIGAGAAMAALPAAAFAAEGAEPAAPFDPSSMYPGDGGVHLPARTIFPPKDISPQAQQYLAVMANKPIEDLPPIEDKQAWRDHVAHHNATILPPVIPDVLPGVSHETREIDGVTVYVVKRLDASEDELKKAHLFAHGGGWAFLGGRVCSILTQAIALAHGGVVYGVDYRTPPDHPFPVPLEDCLTVYKAMLEEYPAEAILVSGSSAGSNLVASMMHLARDKGLPMPGALFLNTPPMDLTCKSETLTTNMGVDVLLKYWVDTTVDLYLDGADKAQPYASPLFGKLEDFPPTYIRTGTRDLLLSDSCRMHVALRQAGVEADLFVHEAMPHGGFNRSSPEDKVCTADTQRWLDTHWPAKPA